MLNNEIVTCRVSNPAIVVESAIPALLLLAIIIAILFIIIKKCRAWRLVIGGIATTIGFVGTLFGAIQRGTSEYKLASLFDSKEAIIIDAVFYIGICALVIGVILLFLHFKNNKY